MLILLSPSKTLDYKRLYPIKNNSIPSFLKESQELIDILKQLNKDDLKRMMKISEPLAQLNIERIHQWRIPFPENLIKPAIIAFKGDVYEGLRADKFTESDLTFSMKHLRILSGLYGLLRPLDSIMAYRLEMGISLKNSIGKNLYKFWGYKITLELNKAMAENNNNHVINLASAEYFKVINQKKLNFPIITPVFKELKSGSPVVVSIHAKRARGLLSNFIITNRLSKIEAIKEFNLEGYFFHPDYSTDNEWVFVR